MFVHSQPSTSNSTQVVMKRLVAFPGITAPQLAVRVPWFAATGTWARASPATPPRHGGSCGRPHHPGDGRGPPWRTHQARTNTHPKGSNNKKGTDTHQKRAKCEERSYTYQA